MRNAATSDVSAPSFNTGAANTKGAWAEIVASTTHDTDGVMLFWNTDTFVSGQDAEALLDIGIGAAASEQVVVSNMRVGRRDINPQQRPQMFIPMRIPAGSRIAMRGQSVLATRTFAFGVDLVGVSRWGQQRGFARCTTLGADSADSGGVLLATPGGNNTKGAWTEISASTSVDAKAILAVFGCTGDIGMTQEYTLFDVAVGGAGSEQVIVPDMQYMTGTSEVVYPYLPHANYMPVSCSVPAGSRISARYQSSGLGNDWDAVIYLFS